MVSKLALKMVPHMYISADPMWYYFHVCALQCSTYYAQYVCLLYSRTFEGWNLKIRTLTYSVYIHYKLGSYLQMAAIHNIYDNSILCLGEYPELSVGSYRTRVAQGIHNTQVPLFGQSFCWSILRSARSWSATSYYILYVQEKNLKALATFGSFLSTSV